MIRCSPPMGLSHVADMVVDSGAMPAGVVPETLPKDEFTKLLYLGFR
jgi:hypothetical protein